MTQKPFLTINDVAKLLSVTRRTVYHWIKKGILHPTRVGSVYRFHPDDVEGLVQRKGLHPVQKKINILSIDDDILVRESLKILFERCGFETTVVSSGKEALDVITQKAFDLVITDVRMPEMDGIETIKSIRELRRRSGLSPLPEIIISGYEDQGAKEEAGRMGVRRFIQKPFEWQSFLKNIQTVLTEHHKSFNCN